MTTLAMIIVYVGLLACFFFAWAADRESLGGGLRMGIRNWDASNMDEPAMDVPFQTITLEKIKIALQNAEKPMMLHGLTYEQRAHYLTDMVIHQFSAYIYGRKVREEKHQSVRDTEKVPVSWWDHAKKSLKARWPRLRLKWNEREIETRIDQTVNVYHTCPHLAIDSGGRHLQFVMYDGSDGYMPLGLEEKAREAVESYLRNRPSFTSPELDRAMFEMRRILETDRR